MQLLYDQGTLVLSSSVRINGIPPKPFIWDNRIQAYRALAVNYLQARRELEVSDPEFKDLVHNTRPRRPVAQWDPPALRPYQETALNLWSDHTHRGIIVLPTGAGKTRLALRAMAQLKHTTLCLVPTRALLEQWHNELRKYYSGSIGVLGDGSHTIEAITVSTYESAYRKCAEIGNQFDLIVVDECHHFGGGIRDEILEMCTAPSRLGLTATPHTDEARLSQIEQLIGPTVFELTVGDLTGSYLADYHYFSLQVDLSPEERTNYRIEIDIYQKEYQEFRRTCPTGKYQDWIRFAAGYKEGRKALSAYHRSRKLLASASAKLALLGELVSRHWGQKLLIFTADTETTYRISREHLIMPITAEIGRKERERMLQAYRDGRIHALASCRVLNEGLDVPDAEVAIILGGNHGIREHVQRIGRILRPSPGKQALIYELVCRNTIEVHQSRNRSRSLAATSSHSM